MALELRATTATDKAEKPVFSTKVKATRGRKKGVNDKEYAHRRKEKDIEKRAKKLDIHTTNVFAKLKDAENIRVLINRGGARSSKSHSLTQYFIERLFFPRKRKILVIRKNRPNISAACSFILHRP